MNTYEWQKSSFSTAPGNCVEVVWMPHSNELLVRHSKHPDGEYLVFTKDEWNAFIAGVKNNEFDL